MAGGRAGAPAKNGLRARHGGGHDRGGARQPGALHDVQADAAAAIDRDPRTGDDPGGVANRAEPGQHTAGRAARPEEPAHDAAGVRQAGGMVRGHGIQQDAGILDRRGSKNNEARLLHAPLSLRVKEFHGRSAVPFRVHQHTGNVSAVAHFCAGRPPLSSPHATKATPPRPGLPTPGPNPRRRRDRVTSPP